MKNYLIISGSLFLAIVTRVFLVAVYRIPSDSMSPTFLSGDYILASQISYGLKFPWTEDIWFQSKPKKGDLVVFSFKNKPAISYIKRITAVEGDEVQTTNGIEKVAPHEVYVLSDNPQSLEDSRQFGMVSVNQIESKAQLIWFSVNPEKEIRWDRIFKLVQSVP